MTNILKIKNNFLEIKEFALIYIVFLLVLWAFTFLNGFRLSFKVVLLFLLLSGLGIFLIYYYSINKKSLHKLVFLTILCFGIISLFLTPILDVPDESEHLVRGDFTSRGIFFPQYDFNINGYNTFKYVTDFDFVLLSNAPPDAPYEIGPTIYGTDFDTSKINYNHSIAVSTFGQNPFYGYLAQGIGIGLAKLLSLNVIWTLWLGRLCNLLLYCGICTLAIKKAPVLKVPLAVVACFPLAVYLAASLSIDSLINSLGLLVVAYFLYLIKSEDNSIGIKNILIFGLLCLILGLSKLSFILFALLILFIPLKKFKSKKYYVYTIISVIFILLMALLWFKFFAGSQLAINRAIYMVENGINSHNQLNFLLSDPINNSLIIITSGVKFLERFLTGAFDLGLFSYKSFWGSIIYGIFFVLILLFNKDIHISRKTKIGSLLVFLIIYFGTFFIQYLTWTPIGFDEVLGVQVRYFIPLFALLPIIFGFNKKINIKNKDFYIITLMFAFLSLMISLTFLIHYV